MNRTLALPQAVRFCTTATPETLRRNRLTAPFSDDFFKIARVRSLRDARIWLLGQLVLNYHPDAHTPERVSHPNPQPSSPHHQSPDSPRTRLQQHIETAALQLDNTATPF